MNALKEGRLALAFSVRNMSVQILCQILKLKVPTSLDFLKNLISQKICLKQLFCLY